MDQTSKASPLRELAKTLIDRVPGVKTALDEAASERGTSYLDVSANGRSAVLEWRPGYGFGISSGSTDGYGLGPDEVVTDPNVALGRVLRVLQNGERTLPRREIALRRLRELRSLTQQELAQNLGVKQASVSKLESREDILVSTFRRVVAAMGGEVEITIRFPDVTVQWDGPGERTELGIQPPQGARKTSS